MPNKVLIVLGVPSIEMTYEVFIPINKSISTIIELLKSAINDLSEGYFPIDGKFRLYNKNDGTVYNEEMIVYDTNIRNGTKLILI